MVAGFSHPALADLPVERLWHQGVGGVPLLVAISRSSVFKRLPIARYNCEEGFRYRPKGVFGKGVGNSKNASKMRQTCVKNASKWVLFYWEKRNVPKYVRNATKLRQKCVKNARNTFGENNFWTIPRITFREFFGVEGDVALKSK